MQNTERVLSAYAEAGPWKADHADAMLCFEVEDMIRVGNFAFDLIVAAESAWQQAVTSGKVPFREVDDEQIDRFYRRWLEISERNGVILDRLIAGGFSVEGYEDFEIHLEEARAILDSRALEAEMLPIEEILAKSATHPDSGRTGS